MSEVWTHGTWTVTAGREKDFVRLWEQLGDWTVKAFPGARGTLLRDTERPNVFISFGPWPDRQTAARWRASAEFQKHVAASVTKRRTEDTTSEATCFLDGICGYARVGCALTPDATCRRSSSSIGAAENRSDQ